MCVCVCVGEWEFNQSVSVKSEARISNSPQPVMGSSLYLPAQSWCDFCTDLQYGEVCSMPTNTPNVAIGTMDIHQAYDHTRVRES